MFHESVIMAIASSKGRRRCLQIRGFSKYFDLQVVSTNDNPTRKASLDLINGIAQLAYPSVTLTEAIEAEEFNVGDIANALFDDMDKGQHLGLAVLGFTESPISKISNFTWKFCMPQTVQIVFSCL